LTRSARELIQVRRGPGRSAPVHEIGEAVGPEGDRLSKQPAPLALARRRYAHHGHAGPLQELALSQLLFERALLGQAHERTPDAGGLHHGVVSGPGHDHLGRAEQAERILGSAELEHLTPGEGLGQGCGHGFAVHDHHPAPDGSDAPDAAIEAREATRVEGAIDGLGRRLRVLQPPRKGSEQRVRTAVAEGMGGVVAPAVLAPHRHGYSEQTGQQRDLHRHVDHEERRALRAHPPGDGDHSLAQTCAVDGRVVQAGRWLGPGPTAQIHGQCPHLDPRQRVWCLLLRGEDSWPRRQVTQDRLRARQVPAPVVVHVPPDSGTQRATSA